MKSNISIGYFLELLLAFTEKEIKARYKNAVLGFLWILLNPLLQMLIIGFIFQNFIDIPVSNYFLFIFTGLLPWNFFSYSFTKTTPSIVYERALIQKAKFPHEIIPLSIILSNFFHLLISLALLITYLLLVGNINLGIWQFIKLFSSLLWLLIFTSGLSLFTSALDVKYRDVNFFVQALATLWFYATPVIYSLQILPKTYFSLFCFNPIAYPFEMLRSSLINTPLPPTNILITNLSLSLIITVLGSFIFYKESKTFSDWL